MRALLPLNSPSPLAELLRHVPASIATVAPEKIPTLAAEADAMTLEVRDVDDLQCEFRPSADLVTVSRGWVEVVWVLAYGYWVVYEKTCMGVRPSGQLVDLTATVELRRAAECVRWASQALVDGRVQPWTTELPSVPVPLMPYEDPSSPIAVASDLSLCALGYLLHHELAHRRLRHAPRPPPRVGQDEVSIDQERDADRESASWILGERAIHSLARTKRGLGAAIALLSLTARGIHRGSFPNVTHPRSFDRLFNTLSEHFTANEDVVWSFVVAMLKLHLDGAELPTPALEFDDFRSCADAYVELLAARG